MDFSNMLIANKHITKKNESFVCCINQSRLKKSINLDESFEGFEIDCLVVRLHKIRT